MDDFYKDLRDNLENRPEPPFDEKDWQDMNRRLDEIQLKPRNNFPWWWILPLLFLPLVFTNILFYYQLKEANSRLGFLELKRDTVFQTKYLYSIDTVFQTRIVKEYVETNSVLPTQAYYNFPTGILPKSPGFSGEKSYASFFSTNSFDRHLSITELWDRLNPQRTGGIPGAFNATAAIVPDEKSASAGKEAALGSYPLERLDMVDLSSIPYRKGRTVLPELYYTRSNYHRKINPVYLFHPKKFRVGIGSAYIMPSGQGLSERKGFSTGVLMALDFYAPLRLQFDAFYNNLNYQIDKMDEAKGVPPIAAPNDNLVFKDARVSQNSFQYDIGLQYIFGPENKWKPFAGIGYTALSFRPYEVKYEFFDELQNLEVVVEEEISRRELITNLFSFSAGIEYDLSKSIHWQLESYYRLNTGNRGLLSPNVIGLRTSLFYSF